MSFLFTFDIIDFLRSAIPFAAILVVLVVIHELGHFVAAKAFGIKVLEFGVGFPPRIKGLAWRRGETLYTINWLPIGGFVRMLGEEDPSDPRSLAAAPRWKRLTVMAAGVVMNLVLALLLFTAGFMIPQERSLNLAQVSEVMPDSPASTAVISGTMRDGTAAEQGLMAGDIVLEVNGREVRNIGELIFSSRRYIGETQTWVISRANSTLEARVYARWRPPEGQGPTGIRVGPPTRLHRGRRDGRSHRLHPSIPLYRARVVPALGGGRPRLAGDGRCCRDYQERDPGAGWRQQRSRPRPAPPLRARRHRRHHRRHYRAGGLAAPDRAGGAP